MRKRVILAILIAMVAVLTNLAFNFLKNQGPWHAGHSLSYWLEDPRPEGAETAIRAIGTNAIPCLLRWISADILTSKVKLPGLPAEQVAEVRDTYKGLVGFARLGSNAAPAIPALVKLMKDRTRPSAAVSAIYSLAYLGEQALPYLTSALSDTNQSHRPDIVIAISSMPINSAAPTNACLTPLLKATTDGDEDVRYIATDSLRRIAPDLLTNTPAK